MKGNYSRITFVLAFSALIQLIVIKLSNLYFTNFDKIYLYRSAFLSELSLIHLLCLSSVLVIVVNTAYYVVLESLRFTDEPIVEEIKSNEAYIMFIISIVLSTFISLLSPLLVAFMVSKIYLIWKIMFLGIIFVAIHFGLFPILKEYPICSKLKLDSNFYKYIYQFLGVAIVVFILSAPFVLKTYKIYCKTEYSVNDDGRPILTIFSTVEKPKVVSIKTTNSLNEDGVIDEFTAFESYHIYNRKFSGDIHENIDETTGFKRIFFNNVSDVNEDISSRKSMHVSEIPLDISIIPGKNYVQVSIEFSNDGRSLFTKTSSVLNYSGSNYKFKYSKVEISTE